jgi:hypothetical protein
VRRRQDTGQRCVRGKNDGPADALSRPQVRVMAGRYLRIVSVETAGIIPGALFQLGRKPNETTSSKVYPASCSHAGLRSFRHDRLVARQRSRIIHSKRRGQGGTTGNANERRRRRTSYNKTRCRWWSGSRRGCSRHSLRTRACEWQIRMSLMRILQVVSEPLALAKV